MQDEDETSSNSDTSGGSYEVEHQWADDETPSDAVLRAVATVSGTDQTALPLLYEAIDPDALDRLIVESRTDEATSLHVNFRYAGYDVRLHGCGLVRLEPVD